MKRAMSVVPIGLAAMLTLVLSLAGIWTVIFQNRAKEPVRLAADVAEGSAGVRQAIGVPLKTGTWIRGNLMTKSREGNADITNPVYGPLGQGILEEWAQEDAESGDFAHFCFDRKANFRPASLS
jgi:Cytochrome oxidase complex assembly protein 1